MIKVIRPGKKYRIFYRAVCKNCDCHFEFDKEDIRIDYDGPIQDSYVLCPNPSCGCAITKWDELKEEFE